MSDTILGGDFTVYYGAENRQKRIVWTGSATGTRTVNQLYSAIQDLFDELTQMDDGSPMSAQTPTEYTIGIIDAGDKDPWFIDRTTVEHLTGGALKTASWDRVTGTNTGIIKIICNNTDIVSGDIGNDITLGGNTGTLLDVKGTGAGSILWVRPDDNTATNDFDDAGTLTCNAHTATWTSTASAGESLWANIYTIGTIEANTHIYIYQNAANLTAYKAATDWWSDGHIDILVNVKELGVETDEGVISVYARQYSKSYSYYIVDLTNGGRNPIPLQTGNDLDNQTGYKTIAFDGGNGSTLADGDVLTISGTARAVVTSVSSGAASATGTFEYYLIGDPITDLSNNEAFTASPSGKTGDINGSSSNYGPAALGTPPTVTFGGLSTGGSNDIDENGTAENYSITIDCNQNSLANVYEWTKYVTRRGSTADIDSGSQTIEGQFYIGSDYKLFYTSVTGTVSDGAVVTQTGGAGAGASGTVVNHNTTDKILVLRVSRGTFSADGTAGSVKVQVDGSNYVVMNSGTSTATAISPIAAAPFGTFAGGKFFCAPGVVLSDYLTTEANNFQLVDDDGTVRVVPTKATITVANTRAGDKIAVFRLTASGGDIDKSRYSGTVQSAGATSVIIDTGGGITFDEPGKSAGGVLRIVDVSANTEYRLRFSSWSGSTFTLASTTGLTADAGSNTTTIVDSGVFATAKVGDLIRATSPAGIAYITAITDNNTVTISPAIASFTTGSTYEINTLPIATATNDTIYVPFIDAYETTGSSGTPGSESVTITHSTSDPDIFIRVRARHSGAGSPILPFEQDSSVVGANPTTVSVIRSSDTIFQ